MGANAWSSFENAFNNNRNVVFNASDTPDLSNVSSMANAFRHAWSLNSDINDWDVSSVTDMSYMFFSAYEFNQPLNDWDVSSVTNMKALFSSANSFNQPLNNWNVSNVTNMSHMFRGNTAYNQPLDNWNVSNVRNMYAMFFGSTAFNQPLNNWDVFHVTDMQGMFGGAAFNQPLDNWDVTGVKDMRYMFRNTNLFNQPLNNWDLSGTQYLSNMFENASAFNQPLNNWNVSNITQMTSMLSGSGVSVKNYDLTLTGWSGQAVPSNIKLGAVGLYYCISGNARSNLTSVYGWQITDSGLGCPVLNYSYSIFSESSANDGSISNTIEVNLTHDKFINENFVAGTHYLVDNIPLGLTLVVSRLSSSRLKLELTGSANQHSTADIVNNVSLTLLDASFVDMPTGQVINNPKNNLSVDFTNNYIQTDFSLSMTPLQTGKIKTGDDVSFKYEIKNEGPNSVDISSAYLSMMTPPEFQVLSVSSSEQAYYDQPYLVSNTAGMPQLFYDEYGDQYFSTIGWSGYNRPVLPHPVGDKHVVIVSGVATSDFVSGSTKFKSIYANPDNEQDFSDIYYEAINDNQDFFALPGNNTATYTYQAPATTPNSPGGSGGTNPPTNPTNPPGGDGGGGTVTTPTSPAIPTIPKGLIPATKVDTGGKPPTFKQLVEDKLATGTTNDFAKKNLEPSKELKSYILTGTTAQITKNLPWILLALLAMVYFYQSLRQSFINRNLRIILALTERTQESLDALVSIISHYLGAAATIISSSVDLLAATNNSAPAPISTGPVQPAILSKLKSEAAALSLAVNGIIARLQDQTESIGTSNNSAQAAAVSSIANTRSRLSLKLWVILPSIISAVLLAISLFGMNQIGIWSVGRDAVVFGIVFLLASIILVFISFRTMQASRNTRLDLDEAIAASRQATDSKRQFIEQNHQTISSYADKMKRAGQGINDPRLTKLFNVGVVKLASIATAFASVYQLSAQVTTPERPLTSLDLSSSINRFKQDAADRGVSLKVDIADNLNINLLKTELDHLVETIVSNAIKFTPEGGTVGIAAKSNMINKGFNFQVKDDGPGIPKDKLATLMQPFNRATSNITYDYDGLGLNLYIARLIADRYDAKLNIRSVEGEGSLVEYRG